MLLSVGAATGRPAHSSLADGAVGVVVVVVMDHLADKIGSLPKGLAGLLDGLLLTNVHPLSGALVCGKEPPRGVLA